MTEQQSLFCPSQNINIFDMKVAPNFVVSLLTSVFLCPHVAHSAAELDNPQRFDHEDDEGGDGAGGGAGIPLRKWRNEAKNLRQRHRRDRKMSQDFHDDGDLMMLAEFYANRTLFEERQAEQSVSTGADASPRKGVLHDVIIVGAGWSGISAGKLFYTCASMFICSLLFLLWSS